MDKQKLLYEFWSSFGISAYDENSVPTGANAPELPYITYTVSVDTFDTDVSLTASVWYYGTDWTEIDEMLETISQKIGMGGICISSTDGAMWVKRGQPFSQRMNDTDDMVRRYMINISVEFISAN